MTNIFKENTEAFDGTADAEYFLTKEHKARELAAIQMLAEVLPHQSGRPAKVLSVACSTGLIELHLQQKLDVQVFGIDGSHSALTTATKRGVQAVCGDVTTLPFGDNSMDHVIAGEIIEHVFDVRGFLAEINRVMKSGGYFVLTTPNLAKLDDRVKFLFGIAPRQVAPLHEYLYLHIRPFTAELIERTLAECGFSNTTIGTNAIRVDLQGRTFRSYSSLLTRNFPGLGATLIVRSQKQ